MQLFSRFLRYDIAQKPIDTVVQESKWTQNINCDILTHSAYVDNKTFCQRYKSFCIVFQNTTFEDETLFSCNGLSTYFTKQRDQIREIGAHIVM